MEDFEFPEKGRKWYYRKAMDGEWVHIRADARRYIYVRRNGVTIPLFHFRQELHLGTKKEKK